MLYPKSDQENFFSRKDRKRYFALVIALLLFSFFTGVFVSSNGFGNVTQLQSNSQPEDQFMQLSNQVYFDWMKNNKHFNMTYNITLDGDNEISDMQIQLRSVVDGRGNLRVDKQVDRTNPGAMHVLESQDFRYQLHTYLGWQAYVIFELQEILRQERSTAFGVKDNKLFLTVSDRFIERSYLQSWIIESYLQSWIIDGTTGMVLEYRYANFQMDGDSYFNSFEMIAIT
ncbi:MAG: hypothetical protein ACXAC2_22750 [Candidatus Kariarchaeaceae archaeon]